MIFSEVHGAYYRAVAKILRAAVLSPVTRGEIREIIKTEAFSESAHAIESALCSGRWQLLLPDGTTPLRRPPTLPLGTLELRWLKSLTLDPRIRLFDLDLPELEGVSPLFVPGDFFVFDKCSDGDPFEDEGYISRFRTVVRALHEGKTLLLSYKSGDGRRVSRYVFPVGLEYSEKDDKFRLLTLRTRRALRRYDYVNLGRLTSVSVVERNLPVPEPPPFRDETASLTLEITDGRRALDRALIHFAHFEKETERLGGGRFRLRLYYDVRDETELLIRVLSFGPFVKVTEPERLVSLIKERLTSQSRLL